MKNFVVTIDGPAGSGKTTIAKELGLRLNWFVLESGKLYRAVALIMEKEGMAGDGDSGTFIETARTAANHVRFMKSPEGVTEMSIDGAAGGDELKTQEIGKTASVLASDVEVRKILLPLQRSILEEEKFLIAEGRDMGTRVFHDADVKFFLTASIEVRVKRRHGELAGLGFNHSMQEIFNQIKERDKRDEKRKASPLKPAEDAIIVDTSEMTIREAASELFEVISPRVRDEQESELYETKFRV